MCRYNGHPSTMAWISFPSAKTVESTLTIKSFDNRPTVKWAMSRDTYTIMYTYGCSVRCVCDWYGRWWTQRLAQILSNCSVILSRLLKVHFVLFDCTLLSFCTFLHLLSNRDVAGEEIKELLADFRNKRALGLGSLFGDHQLEGTIMCIIFFASIYLQIPNIACRSGALIILSSIN